MKCYAIFDRKGSAYLTPFFQLTHGQAIRAFGDLARDRQTSIGMHPEDYQLMYLGDYSQVTGELVPLKKIEVLSQASEFVEVPRA